MPRCASAWRATWPRCETAVSEWWAEWSTYRPADFLMFSPRIYWRLFESINASVWPAQLWLVGAALAWLLWFVRRGTEAAPRASAVALGLSWLFVAWAFLLQRYAPINWAAEGFALAFVMQGLGLLALVGAGPLQASPLPWRRSVGLGLLLWALLGHPLLAGLAGRPWSQAEVFGLAPDPTAIGTLGWLLLLQGCGAAARALLRGLWLVPLAWCTVSAATLGTMGAWQALLPLAAAVAGRGGRAPALRLRCARADRAPGRRAAW